ncbi:MAG: C40 family peptidase [Bacteroidetes bacterium]|nr:C40 family peptidase [Bacteroidota bacterium]
MRILAALFIFLFSFIAGTKKSVAYVHSPVNDTAGVTDSTARNLACKMEDDSMNRLVLVDSVIAYSKNFVGYHYKYGSNGQNKSFDCSHFVSYCYKKYGVNIPCSSAGLSTLGKKINIADVRPGDLMFFKGRNSKNPKVGHVSLVIENNDGHIKLIHATDRGVVIDEYDKMKYYRDRFIMARRLDF